MKYKNSWGLAKISPAKYFYCKLISIHSYKSQYVVDIFVTITSYGTATAGESYSLVCSATVTGSTGRPTLYWWDSSNATLPIEMTSYMGNNFTLTFNPLTAAHAGTYTCRAGLGSAVRYVGVTVTVKGEGSFTAFFLICIESSVAESDQLLISL